MSQVLSLQPDELGPADTTRFSWLCRKHVFLFLSQSAAMFATVPAVEN